MSYQHLEKENFSRRPIYTYYRETFSAKFFPPHKSPYEKPHNSIFKVVDKKVHREILAYWSCAANCNIHHKYNFSSKTLILIIFFCIFRIVYTRYVCVLCQKSRKSEKNIENTEPLSFSV